MGPLEKKHFQHIRKSLIQKVNGDILEIGSGTGFNFPLYEHANRVIAVEPEPVMRQLSLPRLRQAHVPIEVIDARAENLPFQDNSFDSVVCTLVFCTIPDPHMGLEEIRRVCKPGGKLLMFEHVKVDHAVYGPLQEWVNPVWKKLCDGCHLNRRTIEFVQQAGFRIVNLQKFFKDIFIVMEVMNQKE
nr:class I SAM-dependent methyltransferase [Cohnella algarum]